MSKISKRSHSRRVVLAGAVATLAAPHRPLPAAAQPAWPSQAIKLVVPFPPGGSTDILARVIGQKLEPVLKQPIIVENRAGAGGVPASTAVARAHPDGHTLMMGHIGTLAFNPGLYPNLAYDPKTDFAAIARIATVPNILAVHPSLPAGSVAELVALAKASPGKLNYGSGGNGSNTHVSMAYFAARAGVEITHVPYRGAAPAVNDLIGNHVQLMMTGGPLLLPLGKAGQLRLLGVSSLSRVDFAPELPVIADTLPGFEAVQWYGLVAPAKTPTAIVTRLNALVNAALAASDVVDTLAKDGAIAAPGTPEAFARQIASEIDVWRDVITRANIRI
jgi:tripartite-type tricarboxylate transporter receptor subunit TctC